MKRYNPPSPEVEARKRRLIKKKFARADALGITNRRIVEVTGVTYQTVLGFRAGRITPSMNVFVAMLYEVERREKDAKERIR